MRANTSDRTDKQEYSKDEKQTSNNSVTLTLGIAAAVAVAVAVAITSRTPQGRHHPRVTTTLELRLGRVDSALSLAQTGRN